jgi:hypothetical protein
MMGELSSLAGELLHGGLHGEGGVLFLMEYTVSAPKLCGKISKFGDYWRLQGKWGK